MCACGETRIPRDMCACGETRIPSDMCACGEIRIPRDMCACGETRIPRDMCERNRYPCDTATDFILKMCYLGVKEEGVWQTKAVYFHNLSSDF